MTNRKKTFTKHLLAGASVAALSVFMGQGAGATAITAAASTATGLTGPTSNLTLTGVHTNAGDTAAAHVLIGADSDGYTLTTGDYAHTAAADGANGDWLRTSANTTMNLTVSSGGSISSDGADASAYVLDLAHNFGTITNAGTIQTTANNGNAIYVTAAKTVTALNNSGTIKAHGTGEAITVGAGGAITTLTNSGTISSLGAGSAISFLGAATSTVTNTGTITAAGSVSSFLTAGELTGSITNGSATNSTAAITNTSSGTALDIGGNVTKGITNYGLITATTGKAVDIQAAISSTGMAFTNASTGVISSDGTAAAFDIGADIIGGLQNSGTIKTTGGSAAALHITGAMTTAAGGINNASTGKISAAGTGNAITVAATVTGSITNSGTISSTGGTGIASNTAVTAGIINKGTISSAGAATSAITVANNIGTSITNGDDSTSGTITASGSAATIAYAGTSAADIENIMGTISNTGTGKAILVTTALDDTGDAGGSIMNGGTISAAANIAIDVANIDGAVTNAGTIASISGNYQALKLGAAAAAALEDRDDLLNNSGTIKAAGTAATVYLAGEAGKDLSITNTGTISNSGGGQALDLSGETSGDVITVTNSGTISAKAATDTAITLSTAGVLTNTGTITGKIVGTAEGAETLNWNGGTITGAIDLGNSGAGEDDAIVVGDASADNITTGGAISGTSTLTVSKGTFNIGHAITLENTTEATENFTVNSDAVANITSDVTITSGTVDVDGTLEVAAGKTATFTAGTNNALTFSKASVLKLDATSTSNVAVLDANNANGTVDFATGSTIYLNFASTAPVVDATVKNIVLADTITIDGDTYSDSAASKAITFEDNSYVLKVALNADNSDATALSVDVTRENTYDTASSRGNIQNVGSALETIGSGGNAALDTVVATLDTLATASEVASALQTLAPDVSGSTTNAAFSASNASIHTVSNRMEVARAEMGGQGIAAGSASLQNGAWGQVFGQNQDQDTKDGVNGYQADTAGLAVGFETAINDQTRAGLAFAYGKTDADSLNASTDIDSYQASIYGTYAMDNWYTDAVASYTYNDYNTKRTLFDTSVANADFNGNQYDIRGTFGYNLGETGGIKITPFAGLAYTYLDVDDYTETGSNANLHVKNSSVDVLKSDLGAKFDYPMSSNGVTYNPHVLAAWDYDFIGDQTKTTSNFSSVAGVTFTSKGADVARNTIRLGAGLDVMTQDNLTVSLDYDYEGRTKFDSHAGTVKARFGF